MRKGTLLLVGVFAVAFFATQNVSVDVDSDEDESNTGDVNVEVSIDSDSSNQEEKTVIKPVSIKRLEAPEGLTPPVANKIEHRAKFHDFELVDNYHWLKDQSYPKVDDQPVLDYLNQENDYFKQFIEPQKTLVDSLFEEFKGRENDVDYAVPWTLNGFEYRWFYGEGAEYKTWVRKAIGSDLEEVLLDESKLSLNHEYYKVSDVSVSPNNKYLAWSVDTTGAERFAIFIKNLESGELLEESIKQTSGSIVWSADSKIVLYTLVSEEWRPYLVKAHKLGTAVESDLSIYEEKDTSFFVGINKSQSGKYLIIGTGSHAVTENYIIPANNPLAKPILMASRENEMEYHVDHMNDTFFIRVNDSHVNFRIAKTLDSQPEYKNWQTFLPASSDVYFTGFLPLKDVLILEEKKGGLDQIRVINYQGEGHYVEFPEDAYSVSIGNNPETEQKHVRLNYESMVTPESVFDYQLISRVLETKKVKEIPSGYDKSQYVTERLWATSRDGVQIPISIVYKKGFKKDASHPMHLYAYGAYGYGMPVNFSTINLSLLDRGFSYAIAHIRGGDEMGYQWYLDGKLKKRQNTFNDFVDVANFLIEENYVAAGNISASGRSAGGELMGAVTIQAPDIWRSIILGVPFVDVLNTMLDDTLPLTPIEWPEWGNPITSAEDYQTILAYSPYDNIEAAEYPPMMVTGGLNDPRVTYWEPAKWTAKMREIKTDDNLLVMRMHMGAGHFSSSGRYARLYDYAEEFAFILTAHEIAK